MKTVEQLKTEIYSEVENSGFLRSVQSQVKSHVYEIVEKESRGNKEKLGFQYEHPLLKKIRKYPLTSLCLDLIQEFLESFKFKYTLDVFKKEINRDLKINRSSLSQEFSIDLSGQDQSVLLSIVSQIVNGNVKVLEKQSQNPHVQKKNNYVKENNESFNNKSNYESEISSASNSNLNSSSSKTQSQNITPTSNVENKTSPQQNTDYLQKELAKKKKEEIEIKMKQEEEAKRKEEEEKRIREEEEEKKRLELEKTEKQKENEGKKKKKDLPDENKETPQAFLNDLVKPVANQPSKSEIAKKEYDRRKAFSEEKQPKKVVEEESGTNQIRGMSVGKIGGGAMSSFMKFSSFNNQPQKNENIDEELDELQQSKDSTRKNPLYSSNESGLDKSYGYDQSVDSMAIEDYEYVERAKKFGKKF